MVYVIGIDGGGSTIRVVVIDSVLTIMGQSRGQSTNPNIVGQVVAARTIQRAIIDALKDAKLSSDEISGIGIGVAGTAQHQSWLRQVVTNILPRTDVSISTDYEIALVGGHGKQRGVMVLAGTGSLAYGINSEGDSALAGGWGYLLGDEGSGYWLGIQALQSAIRMADHRGPQTSLAQAIYNRLHISRPREVITWIYDTSPLHVKEVAALAPLVLEHAEMGDKVASDLVTMGAQELALATKGVLLQLEEENLPITFSGSVLNEPNPLTNQLCERLGLDAIPRPRYSPSIGAALMALGYIGKSISPE